MKLAVVITTLGRIPELRKLLSSLRAKLESGDECVVVAQENFGAVRHLVEEFASLSMPIFYAESERGASVGRNTGVARVQANNPILIFPNDSNWFDVDAMKFLRMLPEDFSIGSMTMRDSNGIRFALPAKGTTLNKWNAWKVLEATLLVRKQLFIQLGGFDSSIGTGANSPWQAGEATDLLLRYLERGNTDFSWLPPSVLIEGIAESTALNVDARRNKLRAYGRGTAWVISEHSYPYWWRWAFVSAGLFAGLRSPSYGLLDGLWSFVGRFEGMTRITLGDKYLVAVKR